MGEVPNVLGKNAEQPSVGLENIVVGSDGQDVESTESNESSAKRNACCSRGFDYRSSRNNALKNCRIGRVWAQLLNNYWHQATL